LVLSSNKSYWIWYIQK